MPWPVSIRGLIFQAADFMGFKYTENLPTLIQAVADTAQDVQDATAMIAGSAPGETTLASAATVNVGGTNTTRVAITGAAAIASLGTVANRIRLVRFTGAVTLTHNATSLILPGAANIVTAAGDTAIAVSDASGNWRVFGYQRGDGASSPAALTKVDIFLASGNYTVPTWARFVDLVVISGGGGAGSGRRGAAGSGRGGGSGAGAGGLGYSSFPTAELATVLTVEVGVGGTPGAAVTTDNTNGNPGTDGGNSRVLSAGALLAGSARGAAGQGGTTGTVPGGTGGSTISLDIGSGSGGTGNAGPGGGPQNGLQGVAGAGGGGGLTAGDVPGNGAGGGFSCLIGRVTNPGSGGAAPGGNGGDGGTKPWSRGFGGAGGGGAAGNAAGTIAGGNGGAGTVPGGPGGGGGGSTNGANSGAGGAGGAGAVYIIARG